MNLARKIQFRAWDLKTSSWAHPESIYIRGDGLVFLGNTNEGNRYIIQLNTGLKDKNGRDIYEGDLVTFPSPFKNHEPMCGEVIYEDGNYLPFIFGWEAQLSYVAGNALEDRENP